MLCGGSDAPLIPIGLWPQFLVLLPPVYHSLSWSLQSKCLDHDMQDWEVLWPAEHFHRGTVTQRKLLALGTWLVSFIVQNNIFLDK
jgi:hypothetical protein